MSHLLRHRALLPGLWLAGCFAITGTVAHAADEVIVDQIREQAKDVPAVPPAAAPAPAPGNADAANAPADEGEDEDVKPAAVELKAPAPKPGEGLNELHEPVGRVKAVVRRPSGRIPLISKVTNDIAKEARIGWAREQQWPHDQADHSTREEDVALLNRQLIVSLMKRQDSHPAVDGYVRWQLLSYAPDLSEARPQEIRAIVANMPPLTRLPVPPKPRNVLSREGGGAYFFSGVQKAFLSDLRPVAGARGYNPTLSVAGSGVGLNFDTPEEIIEQSRAAAYEHVTSRPLIERLNVPTVLYRNALMELIPTQGGAKLEASFIDMKDRLEAGDPSYKGACQYFFDEAWRTRNDSDISPTTRANLAHQMRDLVKKKTLVVKDIEIDAQGNMRVKREAVAFPAEHLQTLLEYLRGPEVAEE